MSKNGIIVTIIGGFMFVFLILALILYFAGVRHVAFDDSYYKVVQTAAIRSNSWGVEIPNIPQIPHGDNVGLGWDILNVLVDIGNFFVNLFNVIITILNVFIDLITFIVSLISLAKDIPAIIG